MRATFANQLAFAEPGREDSIKFRHPLRVGVDMFIRYAPSNENHWEFFYRGQQTNGVEPVVREMLIREFKTYVRLRVKKNIHLLTYDDFAAMVRVVNVG